MLIIGAAERRSTTTVGMTLRPDTAYTRNAENTADYTVSFRIRGLKAENSIYILPPEKKERATNEFPAQTKKSQLAT